MAALVGVGTYAGADHGGCPPFERLRYDFYLESHHGGDLYSVLHVVGFTIFRFCYEARDQVIEEEIRWEARGGEYVLRVLGRDGEDTHVLRSGQNATAWYERADIERIQIVGLSSDRQVTVVPDEPPRMLPAGPSLGRGGLH